MLWDSQAPSGACAQFTPRPTDAGEAVPRERHAFDEDPGAFDAVSEMRSFGHLRRASAAPMSFGRAGERDAGDEAELRRDRRRTRIDQQCAGVEIALGRDPGSSAPASPGGLFAGDDPQTPRIAGKSATARLIAGRIDRVEMDDAPGRRRAERRLARAQNRDCAAAIAALVSGDGANTKMMISSAETASTLRATTPGRSNALAGSSKYISLTMRR